MAPLLNRSIRKKRRSVKQGGEDQRAAALRKAGLELLANADFENVSIARIAKEARCSVGAFYYRYKDKSTYLRQLVSATFRGLENRLQNRLSNSDGQISLSEFLSYIITKISTPENAGIIRATLKLGATDKDALQPYENYREYVAVTAGNIFKGTSKKKIRVRKIREAVQIVFAAINDTALMPKSATMKLDSDDLLNSLCAVAATHIGVRPDIKGKITKVTVIAGNEPEEAPAINKKEAPNKKKLTPRRRGKVTVL
ncbi:TetR/AcrR family transcriptional regulator [Hyphococcus sp.]|uniref:TetR/AcrR family transcriptional regulator n=1 Tax=Hyphococcus sp. TaxID=2038636 RepID=UPI003CCBD803